MAKEVLKKRLSSDLMTPPITIDPWVSCANNLVTDDPDTPLSASMGKHLDESKMNNTFQDAETGDVLVIDETKKATPRALTDIFVDVETNQEIGGIKTFKDTIMGNSGLTLGPSSNAMLVMTDGQGQALITMKKGGQATGSITILAETFNDPYDPQNESPTSKDFIITGLMNGKLDNHIGDGNEGDVLVLDENKNVKTIGLADKFVDLESDQTIDGSKKFNTTVQGPGFIAGSQANGIYFAAGQELAIYAFSDGESNGAIKIKASQFSDPYDPGNLVEGTKDRKLTDLESNKLNRKFEGATEGQVLTINADGYAEPRNAGSGQFVDLISDQTIGGNKTFDNVINARAGAVMGSPQNGIYLVPDGQEILFNTILGGMQGAGTVRVKAATFNDPYNPNNTADGSKDKMITDLDSGKLNKYFPTGVQGQILTLNDHLEAVPMNAGAGQYVDLISNQTIDGGKTFKQTIHTNTGVNIGNGILVLEKSPYDDDHATISTVTGTTIDVTAVTFNDPYNKNNPNPLSKDYVIKSLSDGLIEATEKVEDLEAKIETKSKVAGFPNLQATQQWVKSLSINDSFWNIPGSQITPSTEAVEGAPTAKSISIDDVEWNLPRTAFSQPTITEGAHTITDSVTWSCYILDNIVFLDITLVFKSNVAGSEKVFSAGVPKPFQGVLLAGDEKILIQVAGGEVNAVVSESTGMNTIRHYNLVYIKQA